MIQQEPPKRGKGDPPPVQRYNYVLVASYPDDMLFDTAYEQVHWELVVASTADAKVVTVKVDDEKTQEHTAIAASWEKGQTGRSAKAKTSRETFIQQASTGDWGDQGAPPDAIVVHANDEQILLTDEHIQQRSQATAEVTEEYNQSRSVVMESRTTASTQRQTEAAELTESATASRKEIREIFEEFATYRKDYNMKRFPPPPEPVEQKKGGKAAPKKK